jgi:hypothetical protein
VVRQVLRKELGLKIVEVDSSEAVVEGGNVLWTGEATVLSGCVESVCMSS